jgi:hypothetical protein
MIKIDNVANTEKSLGRCRDKFVGNFSECAA